MTRNFKLKEAMGTGAKLSASTESGKDEGVDGMELKEARGALSASMESGKDEGADGMELKEARLS